MASNPRGGTRRRSKSRPEDGNEGVGDNDDDSVAVKVKCVECDELHFKKDMIEGGDDLYCEDCYNEKFASCDRCGEVNEQDDMEYVDNKGFYCSDCFSEHFTRCEACGEILDMDQGGIDWYAETPYCEDCFNERYSFCQGCDEAFPEGEMEEVDGEYYCPDCAAERRNSCHFCGETRNLYPLGEDLKTCKRCAAEYLVKCKVCGNYAFEDEIEGGTCAGCRAKSGGWCPPSDHVAKEYPGIMDRIDAMYKRSARNRAADARDQFVKLQRIFPGIKMDFHALTYFNEHGMEKPISALKSTARNPMKSLLQNDAEKAREVSNIIDKIVNTASDIASLDEDKVEVMKKVITALRARSYNERYYPSVKESTDKLEGEFVPEHDRTIIMKITKDPVAMLAKSTSQCWENKSCEKLIRGQYGNGAFSDIERSNLVCYVIDKYHGNIPLARIMVRWCRSDTGDISFGIEKKWYFCTEDPETSNNFAAMGDSARSNSNHNLLGKSSTLKDATKALKDYIVSKGFDTGYDTCQTPYEYGGFSDTAGRGHTSIKYEREE